MDKMPCQRTLLGRRTYLRFPPHRFRLVFALALVVLVLFSISPYSANSLAEDRTLEEVQRAAQLIIEKIPRPKLPKLWHPFGEGIHEPPEEAGGSHGATRWFSDLEWLNPFSASITLDENRAVLPPLPFRQPIYTYYHADTKKDSKIVEAEHHLILTWRRAWWAQGFEPMVLGRPEAQKHPLFDQVQAMNLNSSVQIEVEKWLAWSHMGGGILADWLALPICSGDDKTLAFLREGRFLRLTRYKNLQSGLFFGGKTEIEAAIRKVLERRDIMYHNSVPAALPREDIHVESQHSGIAFYDMPTIASKYKPISSQLERSQASGLVLLQKLLNAHLHIAWQNTFSDGIILLQPYPENTRPIISYANTLAQKLLQCPDNPLPHTCPPNQPRCRACVSTSPSHLQYPITKRNAYKNTTSHFTLGTIPHPYTFISMRHSKAHLDARFVRRQTEHDAWLKEITSDILGSKLNGPQRLVRFKETVASPFAVLHSLWLTAEQWDDIDWSWVFGFALPVDVDDDETFMSGYDVVSSDGTGLIRYVDLDGDMGDEAGSTVDPARQRAIFDRAVKLLKDRARTSRLELGELGTSNKWLSSSESRGKGRDVLEMVEAWNRADSEAWRFVRAFTTRRMAERLKWEEEEKAFAGAEMRPGESWAGWMKKGLEHHIGFVSRTHANDSPSFSSSSPSLPSV